MGKCSMQIRGLCNVPAGFWLLGHGLWQVRYERHVRMTVGESLQPETSSMLLPLEDQAELCLDNGAGCVQMYNAHGMGVHVHGSIRESMDVCDQAD